MRFHQLSRAVIALICLTCAQLALARTVYKCVDAHANLALQDTPCPPGSRQTREELEVPPEPPPPSAFDALPAPLTEHVVATPPPAVSAAVAPAPPATQGAASVFFCTRAEDGTRYVSADGKPPTRWVPAGILGAPGRSLAQTYGPGGGAGVSAPGLNKTRETHAPPNGIAREYVEVVDECTEASPAQTCDYLHDQLDDVERKLRRAFNDQRAVLEPRRDELRQQLDGC